MITFQAPENFQDFMDLGAYADANDVLAADIEDIERSAIRTVVWVAQLLRPIGAITAGIHGYRRSQKQIGVTIGWAALGLLFPVITNVVAVAQGFGKPKGS